MHPKRDKTERRDAARRRLREQPTGRMSQTTSPRGNSEVDRRDLARSIERLEAVVGR